MNYWLLIIPFTSALLGWLITRFFLYMLFRPEHPRQFLGIRYQGILPKRQAAFSKKAGEFAEAEFAKYDPGQKISDPANLEKVMPLIEEHIDDFLRNKLKEQMPVISMFIGNKTIDTLKTVFLQEIKNLFPVVMTQFAGNLRTEMNVKKLVADKLASVSPDKIKSSLSKELRLVQLLGLAAGFLIGIVQLLIIIFIN